MTLRALALVAAIIACAGEAHASTGYSDEIERHLALAYAPKCSLCHEGADGGTVDMPFAKSMLARGMRGGGDLASLDAALDAMKRDKVDSDGDGRIDVDELAYGSDPNVADVVQGSGPAPNYGCATAPSHGGAAARRSPWSALPLAVALGLALSRRRSRCPRSRGMLG